jgi:kumamolisin
MSKSRIVLKGSHRNPIPNSQPVAGPGSRPDPNTHVEVTISLRRKASIPTSVTHSGVLNKEQLTADYGATASDFMAIQQFAEEYNLKIVEESPLTCTVKVSGRLEDLEKAFGTSLKHVKLGDRHFRQRTGHISLPEDVSSIIEGVFGLDDRPQAQPRFRSAVAPHAAHAFSPLDIAKLYNFPAGDGTGQTIGIIELDGGFAPADLNTYFHGLGLTTPTVTAVPVSGGTNKPTGKLDSADVEVMLDIEVAGAVAPKATIKVYFAPNTDKGFLDAINKAIQDMCTVISISWGNPEFFWTKSSMNAFEKAFQTAAGLSIPVAVASGDNGSVDLPGYNSKQKYNAGAMVRFTDNKVYKCLKNNTLNITPPGNTSVWQVITPNPIATDFPASAPHALGCGGTHLEGSGTTITKEEVWNAPGGDGYNGASGGGVSSSFAKPSYQSGVTVPPAPVAGGGRGVPDVSGDADPATGYKVRADGKDIVVGGTSAVSPLWAGLIARLAQKLGHRVPFLNPILYAHPNALIDIKAGNNDVGTAGGKYKAGTGWDPCTGLGSPKGAALFTALGGGTTTTPPPTTTKKPTPPPTTTKKPTPPPTTTKKPTPPPTTTKKPTPPPTTTKKPTPPPTTTKKPTPPPTTTKKPTPPPTTTKKPTPPPTTTTKPTPPPTTTKKPTPPPTTTSTPPPTTTGSGSMIGAPAFNNWYQVPPAYEPAPVTPVTSAQTQAPAAAPLAPAAAVSAGDGGQTAIVALVSTVATVATTAITAITAITGIAAGKK